MLKPVLSHCIGHLMTQNEWAQTLLRPHAGKNIRIQSAIFSADCIVLANGSVAMAGETQLPDAIIHIPPTLALRLVAQDPYAPQEVKVTGDIGFASDVAKVMQHFRWDIAEDLSKLMGDVAADTLVHQGKQAIQAKKNQFKNLAETIVEYAQEEQPLIAKKSHIAQFIADVDELRAATDRLEQRIQLITKQH